MKPEDTRDWDSDGDVGAAAMELMLDSLLVPEQPGAALAGDPTADAADVSNLDALEAQVVALQVSLRHTKTALLKAEGERLATLEENIALKQQLASLQVSPPPPVGTHAPTRTIHCAALTHTHTHARACCLDFVWSLHSPSCKLLNATTPSTTTRARLEPVPVPCAMVAAPPLTRLAPGTSHRESQVGAEQVVPPRDRRLGRPGRGGGRLVRRKMC